MTSLAPEFAHGFAERGYQSGLRVFSAEEAAAFRGQMEQAEAGGFDESRRYYKPHLLYPFLHAIATDDRVLDAVESVIGPDVMIWGSALLVKEAPDARAVHWHQDALHYGLDPSELVTAWIALTESDVGNGCVRVIAGSHLRGAVAHVDLDSHPGTDFRGSEVPDVDEDDAVDLVLAPGECSLHHLLTVHGSRANGSSRRRVGYAVRYVPTRARQLNGPDSALLVRGLDRFGHFLGESAPVSEDDPATVARYEVAMARRRALIFGVEVPADSV